MDAHDILTTPLPASWLCSRLGVDRGEIDRLRLAGELFAVRPEGAEEWLYPARQFGPGGTVPAAVRETVRAARGAGLSESRLAALLRRRVGLMGGGRFLDLLFVGNGDRVIAEIRTVTAGSAV
jgi:hypothetical protein